MDCSFCGSQSTTFKEGIAKTGKNKGNPWKAYDCDEPHCKNDKGYPNRTWVPQGKGSPRASNAKFEASGGLAQTPKSTLETKVDQILAILKENFKPTVTIEKDEEEVPF